MDDTSTDIDDGRTMTSDLTDSEYALLPYSFTDDEGREIRIRRGSEDDVDALVAMYADFESEDRSQGVPPRTEEQIRDWLGYLFPEDAYHVIAVHDDRPVGHAFLVPAGDGRHELAIFVLRAYQAAHIGTELMDALLGYGKAEGVTEVWLSVEAWNNHAITLYENVGFEKTRTERTEVEMTLEL
jgi:ribosomal protein S18 acetylase RimI-like enzyme